MPFTSTSRSGDHTYKSSQHSKLGRGSIDHTVLLMKNMSKLLVLVALSSVIILAVIWSRFYTGLQDVDYGRLAKNWMVRFSDAVCLTWLLPLLASATFTGLCWSVIYVDSNLPGRDPPLPFSPPRDRRRSGHTFHLQYALTLYLGALLCGKLVFDQWQAAQTVLE